MVTPAAPRSRSTSAALINMLVRVEPRLVGVLVAVDRANLPGGDQATRVSRSCDGRQLKTRGLKWKIGRRRVCTWCVNWRPAKLISTIHIVCLPVYVEQHKMDNTRAR